ncbi:MAG: O-antigen ligase domain-containing protein [Hyphomicrobiales bacterium]
MSASATTAAISARGALPSRGASQGVVGLIGRGLVWITVFSGALVYREPAPYEILAVATIGFFFAVVGISFVRETLPAIIVLLVFVIGGLAGPLIATVTGDAAMYLAVTAFLAGTSIFFATYVAENTERRMDAIMAAYAAGAVVASLAGAIGYFHLAPGAEMFTLYGRARGTFQDPNPYGAFLILPALFALQRILVGRLDKALIPAVVFAIVAIGIFLSFSRAAWGMLAFSSILITALTFVLAPTNRVRGRISILAVVGVVLVITLIGIALSIPQIRALLMERASLVQDYDSGPQGRFGRYLPGLLLVIDNPFGLGPGGFAKIFPEDPHNTFLKTFIEYSWLSGASYFVIVTTTLYQAGKRIFQAGPYRWYLLPVFAAFLMNSLESMIIDVDHWRHFYLLIGLCWGLIAAHDRARRRSMNAAPNF